MILITGGGGFLGSALAQAFSSENRSVRCVGRRPRPMMDIGNAEYVATDLEHIGAGSPLFQGVGAVIHLASTTIPATSMVDMEYDATTNIRMALRVLDGARQHGVETFVFVSSGGTVYGVPERLPAQESDATHPISSYGVVKLAIEKYVALYARLYGLRGVTLRVANPYGSGQFAGAPIGVIARLLQKIYDDLPFSVWGDGSAARDFLHVDDFVSAVRIVLAQATMMSGTYNVGSGEGHSLNEVIALSSEVTGKAAEVRYEHARPIDVPAIYLCTQKIRSATGWKPTIPLRQGIERLWRELGELRSASDARFRAL
jgi:UDP-glucose 4-epimerase